MIFMPANTKDNLGYFNYVEIFKIILPHDFFSSTLLTNRFYLKSETFAS